MENSKMPSPQAPGRDLSISVSFKRNGQCKTFERYLSTKTSFDTPDYEKADLFKVFSKFDADGDGKLTLNEILSSLEKLGISICAADLSLLLESLGMCHGYVEFEDFCGLYSFLYDNEDGHEVRTPSGKHLESDLRAAFDLFDQNHDGFISAGELQSVLVKLGFKEAMSLEECRSMIASVDSDRDGRVSFQEFKVMMKNIEGEGH